MLKKCLLSSKGIWEDRFLKNLYLMQKEFNFNFNKLRLQIDINFCKNGYTLRKNSVMKLLEL